MRAVIAVVVPARGAEAFAAALEPFAEAVSAFEAAPGGDWRIEAIGPAPDPAKLGAALALAAAALGLPEPRAAIEPLPEKDWLKENLASFRPIAVGRFLLHPSHIRPAAPGLAAIQIDAGEAFGTGEHETTRLCLSEIDRIAKRKPRLPSGARILDMGCGTGVLAIAAAKRWRAGVLAVDIAPEAARVTRENARANGVATLVQVLAGDGYRLGKLRRRRYALILSNILQRPLIALAPRLARSLAPGGRAVLSGFYRDQAQAVMAAHRAQGLVPERVATLGAWCAVTFRKP
jgi:ribosomal protein L11 methyltransferase